MGQVWGVGGSPPPWSLVLGPPPTDMHVQRSPLLRFSTPPPRWAAAVNSRRAASTLSAGSGHKREPAAAGPRWRCLPRHACARRRTAAGWLHQAAAAWQALQEQLAPPPPPPVVPASQSSARAWRAWQPPWRCSALAAARWWCSRRARERAGGPTRSVMASCRALPLSTVRQVNRLRRRSGQLFRHAFGGRTNPALPLRSSPVCRRHVAARNRHAGAAKPAVRRRSRAGAAGDRPPCRALLALAVPAARRHPAAGPGGAGGGGAHASCLDRHDRGAAPGRGRHHSRPPGRSLGAAAGVGPAGRGARAAGGGAAGVAVARAPAARHGRLPFHRRPKVCGPGGAESVCADCGAGAAAFRSARCAA